VTNNANGRPRHTLRRVVIAIALLLLVAFAAAAYIVTTDLGRFKDRITAYASEALGRELAVGELSIRVGRELHVRATKVTLADAAWSGKDPMLSIDSLELTLDTRSLWTGPPRIENLDASNISVIERSNSDGVSNWQFGDPDNKDDGDAAPLEGPPLLIEQLSIKDLDATIDDPSLDQPVKVRIDRFEHGAKGERHEGMLSGNVNDVPLTFTTDIGPRSHIWTGKAVTFKFDGSLGKLTLDASGSVDDLLHPATPSLGVQVSGPDVAYLFGILKTKPITEGPLDASVKISAASGKVDVDVDGTFGEFKIKAEGTTRDLQSRSDLQVTFAASGPNLGHVGRLAGVDRLPDRPFDVSGALARSSSGLVFKDVELHAGSADVTLSGTLTRPWPIAGQGLVMRMHGDDLAEFRNLLQLPGVLQGPFDVTATFEQASGNLSEVHIDGTVSSLTEKITVFLGDAEDFKGTRAEFDISGPDLSVVGKSVDVDELPSLPFHLVGAGTYNVTTVAFEPTTATVGDSVAKFSGTVDTSYPGSLTNVAIDATTPDLERVLAAFGIDGAPATKAAMKTQLSIANDTVSLAAMKGSLGEMTIQGTVSTGLQSFGSEVDYDVSVNVADIGRLLPDDSGWQPASQPLKVSLAGSIRPEHFEFRNVTATYGRATAKISGIIDRPPGHTGTKLLIDANVPSLTELGTSKHFQLPELPASVNGSFEGSEDTITGKGVKAVLGKNTASLNFEIRSGDVPVINMNLASQSIDLRPFQKAPEENKEPEKKAKRDRVIPDIEIPVASLRHIDASANLQIKQLITHKRVVQDVDLDGALKSGALEITRFNVLGRRGTLNGNFSYTPVDGNESAYVLQAAVTGKELSFAPLDEPEEDFKNRPRTNLDGKFKATGTSLHKLLASLDGSLVLDTSEGILPDTSNRLTNMFMGDLLSEIFVTINPFSKSDDTLSLICAVAAFDINQGVVATNPPTVIQTERLNFFINGAVNLGTEALDMTFATQQRKGLGISLSSITNPFTRVTGTLASPSLTLNQKGAVVEGGAAVATAGLTMIAKGLHGRFFADKDPCGTAREQIKKNAASASPE